MAQAQQELPLYGNQPIPNSKPGPNRETVDTSTAPVRYSYSLVSRPTLQVFLPAAGGGTAGKGGTTNAGGTAGKGGKVNAGVTAVVICPGGGYLHLAFTHEGTDVARMLNELGIAAFVLKYRLPNDETMIDKTIGPLQDAQRAIQLVRERAKEWGVDPARVGIMGFSAGGHLASTAGTHFNQAVIDNPGGVSLRPDFMILLYPVISFQDSIGHRGSRDNLIGLHPDAALIRKFSNELQVTAQTPPTFLVHAGDDKTVPVANSLHFYEALQANGVPAEMHIYPHGGHGFGMNNPTTTDQWTDRLKNWLLAGGWLR
ncbi:MAG TPA: alpha/beta hydrolase [Puia sp.]|nr:alpha/beta hydrolase [Puia sp.]